MASRKQITMRVHGLEHQNQNVDAGVFARKLVFFVRGLIRSDKLVNGRNCHEFIITDLKKGSAVVQITEQQANTKYTPKGSSISEYYTTIQNIYDGRLDLNGGADLLTNIKYISRGSKKDFSHIEIYVDEDPGTAVRVDGFLFSQAEKAISEIKAEEAGKLEKLFRGTSFGTFDGTLKAVDLRGIIKEAKLHLTAGGREIDCVCNSVAVPEIREGLDKRAIVEGIAHYDGSRPLPTRLDIKKIRPIKTDADLSRWRGAFDIPYPSDDSGEW